MVLLKYFIEVINHLNKDAKKKTRLIIIDNIPLKNFKYLRSKYKNFIFLKQDVSKKIQINNKIDFIIHAAGITSPFFYRKKPLETLELQ